MLDIENIQRAFDDNMVLRGIDLHVEQGEILCLLGPSGSGKSTLLEAIAVVMGFNPEGGSRNFSFTTRSSHSDLHQYLRPVRGHRRPKDGYFLRAESFYNVATEIERLDEDPMGGPPVIDSYGGKSLHAQSHGESFLALLNDRFGGRGLYILDEPEAALSPTRQLAMLARMHDLVNDGSQFIIATHAPIIMGYPDAMIFELSDGGLQPVDYEETEHYRISKRFLQDRQRMLRQVLGSGDE